MDDDKFELPFLSTIGFMLTYKCTIACPHCIVEAGPHRSETLSVDTALSLIDQARAYNAGSVKGLALTGGEPFYNLNDLIRISNYGGELGFIVSVVTNAFWATSIEVAIETLARLRAIRLLSISTDVFHQKFIPFDNIKNAIIAARHLKLLYNIAVCTDNKTDHEYLKIIDDLNAFGENEHISKSIIYPVGRAQKRASFFNYATSPEPMAAGCMMASSPIIFLDGTVRPCIGPLFTLPADNPMFLGDLNTESLSSILERSETNPILHTIRIWGPHRLVSLLRERGFDELLPKEYISNCLCDICYKLLSDERIVKELENIFQEERMKQIIAYGRIYYLDEVTMAEKLELPL